MKIAFMGFLYESITKLPFPGRGEIDIPEGYTRMYHQTNPNNVESIEQKGLLLNRSSGRSVGDPIGIWAVSDPNGFYGKNSDLATVEFKVPTNEYDKLYGKTLIERDVLPEDIITIHEPWKDTVNFMAKRPSSIVATKNGDYDSLIGNPQYTKAIPYIKEHL